jgi:hypothetical protein
MGIATSGIRGSRWLVQYDITIIIINLITQLLVGPKFAKAECTELASNAPPPPPANHNTVSTLNSSSNYEH